VIAMFDRFLPSSVDVGFADRFEDPTGAAPLAEWLLRA
jgi:hypothetical protein